MTLHELIARLQEIEREHGGDDMVQVTGLYSQRSDIDKVVRVRTDHTSHVDIETDLFTG